MLRLWKAIKGRRKAAKSASKAGKDASSSKPCSSPSVEPSTTGLHTSSEHSSAEEESDLEPFLDWRAYWHTLANANGGDVQPANAVGPAGTALLMQQLHISDDCFLAFVALSRFGCTEIGLMNEASFLKGVSGCANLAELREQLVAAEQAALGDARTFDDYAQYAFSLALGGPGTKVLDVAVAAQLLNMLASSLSRECQQRTRAFADYITSEAASLRVLNYDQFCSWFAFVREIAPDHSNWEEGGAWPLLFDSFVEHTRARVCAPVPELPAASVVEDATRLAA